MRHHSDFYHSQVWIRVCLVCRMGSGLLVSYWWGFPLLQLFWEQRPWESPPPSTIQLCRRQGLRVKRRTGSVQNTGPYSYINNRQHVCLFIFFMTFKEDENPKLLSSILTYHLLLHCIIFYSRYKCKQCQQGKCLSFILIVHFFIKYEIKSE